MGVPITFWNEYNPDQFEIVGACSGWDSSLITNEYSANQLQFDKNGCKQVSKLNDGMPLMKFDTKLPDKTYYTVDGNGYYYRTYSRIFIRNLHPLLPKA